MFLVTPKMKQSFYIFYSALFLIPQCFSNNLQSSFTSSFSSCCSGYWVSGLMNPFTCRTAAFIIMWCPLLSLTTVFVLKSILLSISIATQYFSPYICIKYFFHLFNLNLCVSFILKWVSCRQHIYWSYFLIYQLPYLLTVEFKLLIFKVIIDRYIFIISLLPLYLFWWCSSGFFSFFLLKLALQHFL